MKFIYYHSDTPDIRKKFDSDKSYDNSPHGDMSKAEYGVFCQRQFAKDVSLGFVLKYEILSMTPEEKHLLNKFN